MSNFASLNPIVLFTYYMVVLLFTMFTTNPIILIYSLVGSVIFFVMINRPRVIINNLVYYFFVFLLIALTNPLFVHNGETILFFMNGNPITVEAVVYGIFIAIMLVSVMFWFKTYNDVMTTDKFIYLFGKTIPKISLVISMSLRLIPLFKRQIKKINMVQKTMGLYSGDSLVDKFLNSMRVMNSLITWSLENAVDTADSMRARGYGLKGKSNFSIFKFKIEDVIMLIIIGIISIILIIGFTNNIYEFYYYPVISTLGVKGQEKISYILAFVLMILPIGLEGKDKIQWALLKQKI